MAQPETVPPPPPNPRVLLEGAGLAAKKSWGQNFLRDQAVLADIARAATSHGPDEPAPHVVELGAGLGALTYHLVLTAGRVLAVERDRELAPVLRHALAWAPRLEVRELDAAQLDYPALADELGGALVVTGNLPYQISSRILVSVAQARSVVRRGVFLVQKEVAERLSAVPGSKTYGLLSVLVGCAFSCRTLRLVPPGAFLPAPKVTSAVVQLDPAPQPLSQEDEQAVVTAARLAFATRRKTIRKTLLNQLAISGQEVAALLQDAGIEPMARAEVLTLNDFLRLGRRLRARAD